GKVFDWEKEYTDIMNELIQSEFLITRQAEAFLKELSSQMKFEDKHDNDYQASPRFWTIMDYREIPTNTDYADYYRIQYNDGMDDIIDFDTKTDLLDFLQEYLEDEDGRLEKELQNHFGKGIKEIKE